MIQGVMRFPVMSGNDTLASILMGGNDVRRIGKVLSREGGKRNRFDCCRAIGSQLGPQMVLGPMLRSP